MAGSVLKLLGGAMMLMVGVMFVLFAGPAVLTEHVLIEDAEEHEVTIRSSEVVSTTERIDGSQERRVYYADITYEYTVDGQRYTGDEVYPIRSQEQSRSSARDLVERFPANETATGYVHPDDPGNSFLVRETTSASLALRVFLGLGALLSILGVVLTGWGGATLFGIGPFEAG